MRRGVRRGLILGAFAALAGLNIRSETGHLAAQTASCKVACLHDWRQAGFGEPSLARVGAQIAAQCGDSARINFTGIVSNPGAGWDGVIAEARRQLAENGSVPTVARWANGWLQWAQDEKAHLERSLANCRFSPTTGPPAGPPTRPPDDVVTRELAIDDAFRASRLTSLTFDAEPAYRGWVPDLLRNMLNKGHHIRARSLEFSGDVWIQRDGKRMKLGREYSYLYLRIGDILVTGPNSKATVRDDDSRHIVTVEPNSMSVIGPQKECLTTSIVDRGLWETNLIRGTLYAVSTGTRIQGNCMAIRTQWATLAVRGTEFRVTAAPAETGADLFVAVTEGAVDVSDGLGVISTVLAGESKRFLPQRGELTWNMTNACSKTTDVRFFDRVLQREWPGNSNVYVIEPGRQFSQKLACTVGQKICYGAAPRTGGTGVWGVGLNDREACENCCAICGEADSNREKSVRLTCGTGGDR